MKPSSTIKGASALLGAAFTYASFGPLTREMAKMFGNSAQVTFRFVLSFLILAAGHLIFKRSVKLSRQALMRAVWLGVCFGAVVLLFTISVTLTKLANSIFLLYAGSIVTSLAVGTLVFKEKLTPMKLVAIGLAVVGLAMYSSALLALSVGAVTAVLSGATDGIANGIRKSLQGVDRNAILLYQFAFGTAFVLMVSVFLPEVAVKMVSFWALAAGVAYAVLQIGLANLLLYGFAHFDVNVGTVILATELGFALVFGWVFYQEIPSFHEMVGGGMIFLASILSVVDVPAWWQRRSLSL